MLVTTMSQHYPRVRPCKRLDALSLSVLEENLLRAFFVLGSKELDADAELLGYLNNRETIFHLLEKRHAKLVEQIKAYLIPKLPVYYHQKILHDILNILAKPPFDTDRIQSCRASEYYKLYFDAEWKFRVLGETAHSSDMSEIIPYILKCLLCSHVSELDFSDFNTSGRCWAARCRRVLLSWEEIKDSRCDLHTMIDMCQIDRNRMLSVEAHWRNMLLDHLNNVRCGLIKITPLLSGLKKINVNHLASGKLIWAIGCCCPNLEELHFHVVVSNRTKYTSLFEHELVLSITSLFRCRKILQTPFHGRPVGCAKLKVLSLPVVEDKKKLAVACGEILCYLPHVEELNYAPIATPLVVVFQNDHYNKQPLSLTKIEIDLIDDHHFEEVCKHFQVDIKKLFPDVKYVSMKYSKHEDSLRILSLFPKLSGVELIDGEKSKLEFGPHFTNLTEFKNNCPWDEKRLAGFSKRAPSLERFDLVEGALQRRKRSRGNMAFPKMKQITIREPYYVDADLFIAFIKSTTHLTHLTLEASHTTLQDGKKHLLDVIDDKLVAAIVPSLKKLQVFHARICKAIGRLKYPLTESALDNFLYSCPDLIKVGNVFQWSIPHERIMKIRKRAKVNNWNVDFCPCDDL